MTAAGYAVVMEPTGDPLARAIGLFRESFGREPTHAAYAPGRVNLIGEHTDYNAGLVLPMAIDRGCAAVGAFGEEAGLVRVVSGDVTQTVDGIGGRAAFAARHALDPANFPDHRDGRTRWWHYVAGVLGEHARIVNEAAPPGCSWPQAADIAIASSVPAGSGLSSSAALEVAVEMLVEQISKPGATLHPTLRVRICREAEHRYAHVPCGVMDQTIACLGRAGHALLIDCRAGDGAAEPAAVAIPDGARVVVFDSGVRHALGAGDGEYAKRREACESAARSLGVATLRDATIEMVVEHKATLGDERFRAAKHVVTEIGRTAEAASALGSGDLRRVGELMNGSHASLRDEFRVSCPELDLIAAAAQASPGVFGARITGAGFGGCAVALCDASAAETVRATVSAAFRGRFGRDIASFVTHACDGARVASVTPDTPPRPGL